MNRTIPPSLATTAPSGWHVRTACRAFAALYGRRRTAHLIAGCILVSALLSEPCVAKPLDARSALQDTKLYFTAPLRWDGQDWLYFGGTLLAIGVAHEYDDNVRTHFATGSRAVLDGKDPNSGRDWIPAAAAVVGTWAFATLLDDSAGYEETGSMLEAGGLSLASGVLLKYAAGRLRPNETTRVDAWSQSGDSFPSLHVSAAFAIGTVLAESGGDDFRWIRRLLGYGLAGATAYARVHDNVHWTSDTVAAAALGIATAHFVMNRREASDRRASLLIEPLPGGLMLTYSTSLP